MIRLPFIQMTISEILSKSITTPRSRWIRYRSPSTPPSWPTLQLAYQMYSCRHSPRATSAARKTNHPCRPLVASSTSQSSLRTAAQWAHPFTAWIRLSCRSRSTRRSRCRWSAKDRKAILQRTLWLFEMTMTVRCGYLPRDIQLSDLWLERRKNRTLSLSLHLQEVRIVKRIIEVKCATVWMLALKSNERPANQRSARNNKISCWGTRRIFSRKLPNAGSDRSRSRSLKMW